MKTETAEETSLPSCLCDSLRQTARAVTRLYDQALRPAGLRITQFTILDYLSRHGELRGRDLGAALQIEDSTLVRSVRLLEKEGWVQSHAGADKRERRTAITAKGKAALAKAKPHWAAVQARLRKRIAGSAWDALLEGLPALAKEAAAG